MHEFDLDELGIMGAMLAKSLDFAEEQGAPTVILATLESALNKLKLIIDQRCEEFNEFQSLAEEMLEDVLLASKIITKNVEAEIPEYK
jgi:hypothetical protein